MNPPDPAAPLPQPPSKPDDAYSTVSGSAESSTSGDDSSSYGEWTLGVSSFVAERPHVTTFQIIPTQPDGNCMYRAISQAIYGHEHLHSKCRQDVVDHICDDLNWPNFATHIRGQNDHLLDSVKLNAKEESKDAEAIPSDAEAASSDEVNAQTENDPELFRNAYREYMLQDGNFGTLQELIAASDVFQFNLVVIRQLRDYFFNIMPCHGSTTRDTTHHFLFTGDTPDDGHFEFLQPCSQNLELDPKIQLEKGNYKIYLVDKEERIAVMEPYVGPIPTKEAESDIETTGEDIEQKVAEVLHVPDAEVDLNANLTNKPEGLIDPRSPVRVEFTQVPIGHLTSDSDGSYRREKRKSPLSKKVFQNRVHPTSSDSSVTPLLTRPRRSTRKSRCQDAPKATRGQRSPKPYKDNLCSRCLQAIFCYKTEQCETEETD